MVLWSTPHHWPCRRSLKGGAGGREPEPPALEEGGGKSLQKLYTASGNVYPLPVISESVKTVITDLPQHRERAGWQGLLLSCSLRHKSLFTGGLWTAGRLSGGSGGNGCCSTPPACSWARNPVGQFWGSPCQDAQRGSYRVQTFHWVPLSAPIHASCPPHLPQAQRRSALPQLGYFIGRHLGTEGPESVSPSGLCYSSTVGPCRFVPRHILHLSILKRDPLG